MKTNTLLLPIGFAIALAGSAFAESYQATGPVLELTDSKIVIEKGKEKWSFARTPDTKVTGELKVGSKVTIAYTMTATSAEVKADKAEKKTEKTPDKAPAEPKKKAS